ncbi:hypothetical protein E2C01_097677 [Portunus trituberculatus]|uniref:Uncharacterized protein n=1 Tax=Portunus trituberculatus TaxID=210409 RepID=A0A5B7KA90_PORTR|nr:hypothetical protein [Portunus trituberculatus]
MNTAAPTRRFAYNPAVSSLKSHSPGYPQPSPAFFSLLPAHTLEGLEEKARGYERKKILGNAVDEEEKW